MLQDLVACGCMCVRAWFFSASRALAMSSARNRFTAMRHDLSFSEHQTEIEAATLAHAFSGHHGHRVHGRSEPLLCLLLIFLIPLLQRRLSDTSATTISAGHELDKKVQQKAQIRRQAHVVPVVVDHLCDAPHERVELLLVRGNLREKGASVSLGLNRDPGRRHTSNAITSAQCAKRRNIATERQRACEATHKHCEQHAHYLELLHCALVKHLGAARVGGWAGGGRLGRASSGCGLLLLSSTLVATTTCRLLRVVLQQVLATC